MLSSITPRPSSSLLSYCSNELINRTPKLCVCLIWLLPSLLRSLLQKWPVCFCILFGFFPSQLLIFFFLLYMMIIIIIIIIITSFIITIIIIIILLLYCGIDCFSCPIYFMFYMILVHIWSILFSISEVFIYDLVGHVFWPFEWVIFIFFYSYYS